MFAAARCSNADGARSPLAAALEQSTQRNSHGGHRAHRESIRKQVLLNNSRWSLRPLWLDGLENLFRAFQSPRKFHQLEWPGERA